MASSRGRALQETSKQTRKVRWARDGTVRSVPTPVVVKSEYNVGPRRHFVGYNDSALWRHLVLHHATPHRVSHPPTPSCCGNSSEYRAEVRLALAVASPPPMAAPSDRSERPRRKEFRVVMLQRSQGRVFANISDVAACVAVRLSYCGATFVFLLSSWHTPVVFWADVGHWKVDCCCMAQMEIAAQNPGIDVNVSIVAFEGASLRFQQQQLLDADMFVNVHGAGGINYLWLSPCAVFLDYFSFNHFTPRYFGPPAENMNLVCVCICLFCRLYVPFLAALSLCAATDCRCVATLVCPHVWGCVFGMIRACVDFGSVAMCCVCCATPVLLWWLLGDSYTPAHFMPPPDQIPKCMPQDLRGPGHSYTCMNHRHWSCRQCSRDHSTRIAPPCTSLRTVLRAALLRQDLCRLEMDVGVPPHTWNPHEFVAFGGSVEAYEKRKEVYREDDAMARVARLQMLLRQVQQAT